MIDAGGATAVTAACGWEFEHDLGGLIAPPGVPIGDSHIGGLQRNNNDMKASWLDVAFYESSMTTRCVSQNGTTSGCIITEGITPLVWAGLPLLSAFRRPMGLK